MSDPYCRTHGTNHCRQCMFDKHAKRIIEAQTELFQEQTDRITKGQIEQTDRIIDALNKPCKPQRRKADWPLVVAQVISVIVLVAAVIIVKT